MIIPSSTTGVFASVKKIVAAATGFQSGDLAFNDVTATSSITPTSGNIVTSSKTGTIYMSVTTQSANGENWATFSINGVDQTFFSGVTPTSTIGFFGNETGTFSITSGDNLQFNAFKSGAPIGADSFVITIRNLNSSGTIIDTITISRT